MDFDAIAVRRGRSHRTGSAFARSLMLVLPVGSPSLSIPLSYACAAEQVPGLEALQATRSRPLFAKSRRAPEVPSPDEAPAVAPATPQPVGPTFLLTGVVTGGEKKIAILMHPGDQKSVSIGIGDQIDDWRIVDIRPRSILVVRGSQNLEVELPDPTKSTSKKGDGSGND